MTGRSRPQHRNFPRALRRHARGLRRKSITIPSISMLTFWKPAIKIGSGADVQGLSRAIANPTATGDGLRASVDPNFECIRLVQRIPVRVALEKVPAEVSKSRRVSEKSPCRLSRVTSPARCPASSSSYRRAPSRDHKNETTENNSSQPRCKASLPPRRRPRAARHQRTGIEHMQQRPGIVVSGRRDFREGDVAGCPHEILELAVRHRRAIDQKSFQRDTMDRSFLRIMPVRSMRNVPPAMRRMSAGHWHRPPSDEETSAILKRASKDPNCCDALWLPATPYETALILRSAGGGLAAAFRSLCHSSRSA
jgi:hypothetical protein